MERVQNRNFKYQNFYWLTVHEVHVRRRDLNFSLRMSAEHVDALKVSSLFKEQFYSFLVELSFHVAQPQYLIILSFTLH